MRILIDICIIVDTLQNRVPFNKNAQDIFLLAANRKIDAFITAKSVTDIYYLMHRVTHSDKDTRDVLSRLFKLFELADTTGTDCKYALSSDVSDYEDAVMIETAVRTQVDSIVTRNTKDYSKSVVPVLTPDELIQKVTEEETE